MGTNRSLVKTEAARRGRGVAIAAAGTVAAVALTASLPVIPWLVGGAGLAWTARRAWDWLRYRGEWGLRF